jgi:hypothetical protein
MNNFIYVNWESYVPYRIQHEKITCWDNEKIAQEFVRILDE